MIKADKLEQVRFRTKLNWFEVSHLVTRDIAVVLSPHNIQGYRTTERYERFSGPSWLFTKIESKISFFLTSIEIP
jgi:hypothetical protein